MELGEGRRAEGAYLAKTMPHCVHWLRGPGSPGFRTWPHFGQANGLDIGLRDDDGLVYVIGGLTFELTSAGYQYGSPFLRLKRHAPPSR